jgi:hypothetical protein
MNLEQGGSKGGNCWWYTYYITSLKTNKEPMVPRESPNTDIYLPNG